MEKNGKAHHLRNNCVTKKDRYSIIGSEVVYMKDFIKWLGVNEKIAKVVVWLLIIMVMLIIFNTAMESMGFPHYAVTYENLKEINVIKAIDYITNWIVIILNFYAVMLIVFRVKDAKKLFKFSIVYLLLNILVVGIFDKGIAQLFVIIFFIVFGYIYSKRKIRSIIYIFLSIGLNVVIEGITYMYKVRFIDFTQINETTRNLLSIDYFIIMGIIILVKEVYLKKRGVKDGTKPIMVGQIRQRKQICKETSKKSS